MKAPRHFALLLLTASFLSCAGRVDRMAVGRILPNTLRQHDLPAACALGQAGASPLRSAFRRAPAKAILLADMTAGMCAELQAMELDLRASLPQEASQIKDAREAARRARALAAARYQRAFTGFEQLYPDFDTSCPRLARKEEGWLYLMGALGGLQAVLNDKGARSAVGVPVDLLPRSARAMRCLSNEIYRGVPSAVVSAVGWMLPGEQSAEQARSSLEAGARDAGEEGLRIGWALFNALAFTQGDEAALAKGLAAEAESRRDTPADPETALLDVYAFYLSRYYSDRWWIEAEGYRTLDFGRAPPSYEEVNKAEINKAEKGSAHDATQQDPFDL